MQPTNESASVGALVDLIVDRYHEIESTLPLLNRELSAPERRALKLVAHEKRITIGAIGSKLGMPPSTTTWVVNNLVKKEIFRREPDREDRRKTWIRLAGKGEALSGLLDRIADRIASDLLYKLEPAQRHVFTELVQAALNRISEAGAFR